MSMKEIQAAMKLSIAQNYTRVSFSCDDVKKAIEEYEQLEAELGDTQQQLKQADINFKFVFETVEVIFNALDLPTGTWVERVKAVRVYADKLSESEVEK